MSFDEPHLRRAREQIALLYPDGDADAITRAAARAIGVDPDADPPAPVPPLDLWSERDVLMIAYGDNITDEGRSPLQSLDAFLAEHLDGVITCVHLLPFFPSSSDGGFAVIDYDAVDPEIGTWDDVRRIASRVSLMSDLVLNHVSADSRWFRQFIDDEPPGHDYFIAVEDDVDLSAVVRPRTAPLLREVMTRAGLRRVWCTFSHDQVDLNYANPEVLFEVLRVVDRHLRAGSRLLRLDAVGYAWKEPGTTCIHLEQTHALVRLLNALLKGRDPRALLVTETNVPNRENLTYFGNRNEAHAIYNFSLPPLIIDALLRGSAENLKTWMMSMPPAPLGCTYLNFIASHDGIGLRPAEGILTDHERDAMIETIGRRGGVVSSRATPEGPRPYEINTSLFDALAETHDGPDRWQIERFICAHTIMLALEGVPAFYIHSLLAGENDLDALRRTGIKRAINRRRLDRGEIAAGLADPETAAARVLSELARRIRIRAAQPAFHPNATQFTLQLGRSIFAFWRQSLDRDQSIFALNNVSRRGRRVTLADLNLIGTDRWRDLLGGEEAVEPPDGQLRIGPYGSIWLSNR